jgi:riboflavin biosynthesis pyrimidine reductase
MGVIIGGRDPVPIDASWFDGDEPRILIVGRSNPIQAGLPGTELLRAPDERPEPGWVLDRLAERGIGSVLLEGGPHVNAAFLDAGLIDELYWTVGPHLVGTDALRMIEPIATERGLLPARLVSVLRHDDELFLRYRFGAAG